MSVNREQLTKSHKFDYLDLPEYGEKLTDPETKRQSRDQLIRILLYAGSITGLGALYIANTLEKLPF